MVVVGSGKVAPACWIRGTAAARFVVERGEKAASFTASAALVPQANSPLRRGSAA
jgi:hypothetical protein